MRDLIDKETGEIFNDVIYIKTKESNLKNKDIRSSLKLDRHYNNFIFMNYVASSKLLLEDVNLTQSEITRTIFISSFIGKNNKLMITERTCADKNKLKKELNIANTQFKILYKKLISNNILIEKSDGIYFNNKYAFCGNIALNTERKHETDIIRIYKENIRNVYKQVDSSGHKQLSIFFLLIPFISFEYNIICFNPLESDRSKVVPIMIDELSKQLGYNEKRFKNIINELSKLKDIQDRPIIKQVINIIDGKKRISIIVNPNIIYAGRDVRNISDISIIFKR